MTARAAIVGLLVVWVIGAFFFPLGGMIHGLLILALIVFIIDRVGRGPDERG
ncbi:hypothetical protein BH18GEM1_BH18GEM1_10010 [soil metagenome]